LKAALINAVRLSHAKKSSVSSMTALPPKPKLPSHLV
jgi:hypothetical protein